MQVRDLIREEEVKIYHSDGSLDINRINFLADTSRETDLLIIDIDELENLSGLDYKILGLISDSDPKLDQPYILIPPSLNIERLVLGWMNRISKEQRNLIRDNDIINNAFMQLNIDEASIEDYVDFLSRTINRDIVYHGKLDYKTYCFGENFLSSQEIENPKNLSKAHYLEPIKKNKQLYGHLIIRQGGKSLSAKDKLVIQYTSSMILLKIQNQIAIDNSKEIVRSDLIADLCMNNIKSREEVIFRANLQGWKIQSSGILALIFDIDEFKHSMLHSNKDIKELEEEKQIIYNLVIKEMDRIDYTSYYYQKSDSIIFLVNLDLKNNLSDLDRFVGENIQPIHNLMKEKGLSFTLTIGVGTYYEDIMQAYRSYNEAIEAINISRIFKEVDDISCYKDVLIFKDLMEVMTRKDYHSIYTDLIGRILDWDKKQGTEYFITLRSIIKNDWNLKDSSKDLFIHYNTILYRFEKIKSLLGMDLNNFYEKLIITLTLMMLEVEKHIDFNKGMFKK